MFLAKGGMEIDAIKGIGNDSCDNNWRRHRKYIIENKYQMPLLKYKNLRGVENVRGFDPTNLLKQVMV